MLQLVFALLVFRLGKIVVQCFPVQFGALSVLLKLIFRQRLGDQADGALQESLHRYGDHRNEKEGNELGRSF